MAKEAYIARDGTRTVYQYENIARESQPRSLSSDAYKLIDTQFEKQLLEFTPSKADSTIFNLGTPSDVVLSAGVSNFPIKLYGSKLLKKLREHGYDASDLSGLTKAIREPIAVFKNYEKESNFSILTTLRIKGNNVLVAIERGKGKDAELNIVTTVFGKGGDRILGWINKGYLRYVDKSKARNYLHLAAPIAAASDNNGLISAAKIINDFKNSK